MRYISYGVFNPLCGNQLYMTNREKVPSPAGLTCKPCLKASYGGSDLCCCSNFSTYWPGVTVSGSNGLNPECSNIGILASAINSVMVPAVIQGVGSSNLKCQPKKQMFNPMQWSCVWNFTTGGPLIWDGQKYTGSGVFSMSMRWIFDIGSVGSLPNIPAGTNADLVVVYTGTSWQYHSPSFPGFSWFYPYLVAHYYSSNFNCQGGTFSLSNQDGPGYGDQTYTQNGPIAGGSACAPVRLSWPEILQLRPTPLN